MKKTFLILAALLCSCFALKAQEQFTSDGLNYSVTGTNPPTVELTGHTEGFTAHDLVIPASVTNGSTTYSVTSIGNDAFMECTSLTGSLTIPNSVTSIGDEAFSDCRGFTGSLTIGNSVTSIGNQAFYRCSGLTGSLTIPDSVTSIGDDAFFDCDGFTSLSIGNSVKSIGNQAFVYCNFFTGSLTIPNSVTSIGAKAFYGCTRFTGSLTIPNSVTSIGNEAFKHCSGFTSLSIPNSVTSIGAQAFYGCTRFTGSLTIPNSVTSIGYGAFYQCSGFTGSLTIPNSVTRIENQAFYQCSGFTGSLTIPNSVTHIDDEAFRECSGFNGSLTIPNSVTSIGNKAFYQCSGFTGSLTIPNSVTRIGYLAFYQCSGFTGLLTIPNSVTNIGDGAFERCSGFTGSLTIPNSVTSIGNKAFYQCSGFTGSLTIGSSVESIGEQAFYGCSGFTGSLTIPNSVTSIGNQAFYQCSGFTGSLTIGNSVTHINDETFRECSGFNGSLTIGSSVTSIGDYAFGDNQFAQIISRPVAPPTTGIAPFFQMSGLQSIQSITVPCNSSSNYKYAFHWCNYANIIKEDYVQFELTVASANPDFGSAKIDQPATCQNNGQVTVSATPLAIDCMFTCWTENGEVISTDNPYTFTLESDRNLVANFWEKKYIYEPIESLPSHISSNDIYVLGYQDGNNYYLHSSGTAAGEMKLSLYPANPVEYKFNDFGYAYNLVYAYCDNGDLSITTQGVSLSSFNPFDSTDPFALSITDGNISSAGSSGYTVCHNGNIIKTHTGTSEGNLRFFKRIPLHYITLSVSPEETGTATATSGGETVQSAVEGTEITVSATPTEGYRFKNWTENGEVASTENPYTFTLTADRNLVANFYKPYDFSAICETGQTLYYRIIDAEQHWVSIVAPNSDNYLECYEGYTRPAGNISLPATVSHNEISYTVKAIGDCAFYSCSDLTGLLTIPNSVTNIGEGAFERCSGFTGSLTIPNSVTNIGETAFWNCSGFNGSLTIGSSVTNIGKEAFALCQGFTGSLTIPNSVTNIGEAAFFACSGFKGSLTIPNSVTSIGKEAFYHCSGLNGSLTIGCSVTSIGNSAFEGCKGFTGTLTIGSSVASIGNWAFTYTNFTNIISKAETAPTLASKIPDASGNVYIPAAASTLESYQNRWSGYDYIFIQYNREDYHFNGTGSEWNTAANWEENEVPFMPCHNVFVNADCIFDATGDNAALHSVNVATGKTLTIPEDKTLTADLIILEDGAQLINNGTIACNDLTIKKDIAGYGTGTGGWYLVSSPVATTSLPVGMAAAKAENYDFYRFDQTGDGQGHEWLNYKAESFGIENQSGYLYANKNGTTLLFRGDFAATATKTLTYDGDARFAGFNLVGNPYPCNATISGENLRSSNYFYKMNEYGTALEVVANPVIAPCTGVFAVAANSNANVTFAPTSDAANVTRGEKSSLRDIRVELTANGKVIDRAILNMNGESLPKFRLNDNGSEICFYQDNEELAVASVSTAGRSEMPLNFKAMTTGRYDISVKATDDINHLILIDNMTGEETDMLLESSYSFIGSPADNENRFTVRLGVSNGSDDDEQFVYQYGDELVIDGEGTLQVFDVLGRVVISEEIHGQSVDISKLTTGAYIVRMTGNEVKTQKIIVR